MDKMEKLFADRWSKLTKMFLTNFYCGMQIVKAVVYSKPDCMIIVGLLEIQWLRECVKHPGHHFPYHFRTGRASSIPEIWWWSIL